MKFTDGYWLKRPGWQVKHPKHLQRIEPNGRSVRAYASTKPLSFKGAELDSSQLTIDIQAVAEGVIKVRITHFFGALDRGPHFNVAEETGVGDFEVSRENLTAKISAGNLVATIGERDHFKLAFTLDGKEITSSIDRSMGLAVSPEGDKYIHEQLTIVPGESIYGLGERFGPVVKNGQSIDLWNADGGTASEQAYKNIPLYISDRGYGVFVNHPERVSYEVGSEVNTRVQFSVPGDYLEYFVIAGPTSKDVLRRYTSLTGRPPRVPAWSYGLWLSTSFTTDYSEETVNQFIDRMEELDIPLSVLHFDCYWMRPSRWCDFTWDPEMFPDPQGMLQRYHDRGIKVCVWINPYIGQQSHLFAEGMVKGYLLKAKDGSVRQWDHWQSGMGWVDFTNPDAKKWYQSQLEKLLDQGVDCFKTDFGERVPTDVVWFDGSDPERMHNYYAYLYNQAVFEVLERHRGRGDALVFARAATAGSQKFPVHWGGDSEPTFASMGETLRGGLSLGLSGVGYWSHDMGGFEGQPNPDVFIRWFPFGMFSSHSRLHGSSSYRVPWMYGDTAVSVARRFTEIKNRLMPYIMAASEETVSDGIPLMRHMIMQHPQDRGSAHVDTQYYFGPSIIVAPVFSEDGEVDFYLPSPGYTDLLSGRRYDRAGWFRETHSLDSLPLLVPDGTVLPVGHNSARPDYDWEKELTLYLFQPLPGTRTVSIPTQEGTWRDFSLTVCDNHVTVQAVDEGSDWSVHLVGPTDGLEIERGNRCDNSATDLAPGVRMTPDAAQIIFRFSPTAM